MASPVRKPAQRVSRRSTKQVPRSVPKQLPLIRPRDLGCLQHGGDLRTGRRKLARPFSPDAAMHVVLKSDRARGHWSLLHRRNRSRTDELVFTLAKRFGIRVYHLANVGNHVHLLVKSASKTAFQAFLRTLSGLLARHVTETKKGRAIEGRFWARIPFTRLIHWGREYAALKAYLTKNQLEAWGFRGATLRIHTVKGAPIIVIGDEDFRPGRDDPEEWLKKSERVESGRAESGRTHRTPR